MRTRTARSISGFTSVFLILGEKAVCKLTLSRASRQPRMVDLLVLSREYSYILYREHIDLFPTKNQDVDGKKLEHYSPNWLTTEDKRRIRLGSPLSAPDLQ